MPQDDRPASHTAAMVAWDKLPLPIAEIAKDVALDAPDALEREVHLATTMLCLGLAIALARCREASIAPPVEILESYEDQSPGRLGWAVTQLCQTYPDVLGWSPDIEHPGAARVQKLLGLGKGTPTVAVALDAIRGVRNRWAHAKALPAGRAECAAALDSMLPTLATLNADFHKRLLRIGTSVRAPGEPEQWRALVMAGRSPEPYFRGNAVRLPPGAQPGHVVLLDEAKNALLDLYPFVVGDPTGLWVFWAIENDRPVLRRGAWVFTNGPPPGQRGELDWCGKERTGDLAALREILDAWRGAGVTSVDAPPRAPRPPAEDELRTAISPPPDVPRGAASPTRRSYAPAVWLGAGLVVAASLAVGAFGAGAPTATDLPAVLTALPLRWGQTVADADESLELGRTVADPCVADVIAIRSLMGRVTPPAGRLTAGGLTFHATGGLYEITIRSDATLADARSAMIERLGPPEFDETSAAVWNIDDVRVRVGTRNGQAAFRIWRPSIEALYEAARTARCGPASDR